MLLLGVLALTMSTTSCKKETTELQQYAITVTAGTGGNITAKIDGKAANKASKGVQVTLNALPEEGYTFSHWTVESGSITLSGNPASFTMPAQDVSVRAEFEEEIEVVSNVFDKITDPQFLYYCREVGKFDTNKDGVLSLEEAQAVTEINVNEWYKVTGERIQSLAGIEYFTSLTLLTCYGNAITELNVSKNTELTHLHVGTNGLTTLDVTQNTKLAKLYISRNTITEIDLSQCPDLSIFQYNMCGEMTSIDVSNNPKLTEIAGEQCPNITSLDLSNNTALVDVRCFDGNLASLNVSNCTKLEVLYCYDNRLTSLDVSNCAALIYFDCRNNQIPSLDVSKATSLKSFMCYKNRMKSVDASKMGSPNDFSLGCGVQTTDGTTPQTLTLTLREDQKPYWQYNMVPYQDMNANVELAGGGADIFATMTDPTFKTYCEKFDTDHDGRLSQEEASAVTEINVSNKGITSLVGIQYFQGIKKLTCDKNKLTSLSVASNPVLTELVCNNNQLTELLVWSANGGKELITLNCQDNQLDRLSVAGCHKLQKLICRNNKLTYLNLNNTGVMTQLDCANNLLTSLGLSDSPALMLLTCSNNQLTKIDYLANKKALTSLMCNNNPMTSLDISGCTSLVGIMAYENRLTELNASDMGNPSGYNLFCGNQTSDGSTAQTLRLTLREEQKPYWNSTMKDSFMNNNIVLAN